MDDEIVQCQGNDGKFPFKWDPALNAIGTIHKDMFYHIKLFQDRINGADQILV